jgi:DNA-binding NtrC family response regulator
LLTAFGSIQTAVEAIRAGAYDFITKPFDLSVLAIALDRAIAHRALKLEVDRLRLAAQESVGELLGKSEPMRRVLDLVGRAAASEATVLITGESGTGKELVARALHRGSGRAAGPFLPINCSALPEPLLESELFGHVRGAFTDARGDRAGLLVRASGGTLFLDEIGDMPLGMQVKLLRALQERTIRPVGGDREIPIDVRVVAATHRDLEAEIQAGRFRHDLFFRINVIEIAVPPLRVRGADVLLLAETFLARAAARTKREGMRLSHAVAERLREHDWPGNVRELENAIERAVALARTDQIALEDLPSRLRRTNTSTPIAEAEGELVTLEEMERRYILRVLRAVNGNRTMAAQTLGLDRSTLYRKLDRWRTPEQEES